MAGLTFHATHLLLQQLRLKLRQIKPLSIRLNFSVLVDLNDANAVDEEHISGLGLETQPPFDGSFLTTDRHVKRLDSDLVQDSRERLLVSKDGLTALNRRSSDRVFYCAVSGE